METNLRRKGFNKKISIKIRKHFKRQACYFLDLIFPFEFSLLHWQSNCKDLNCIHNSAKKHQKTKLSSPNATFALMYPPYF